MIGAGVLAAALLLPGAGPAEVRSEPLLALHTTVVEQETARLPDDGGLCVAGALVRFRLSRRAMVTLEAGGRRGSLDGGPLRLVRDVPLDPGQHELVLSPERRPAVASPASFTITANESGRREQVTGSLRDEPVDRPVLPVGRTFVRGVDLLDGHLVQQATDLELEGRHLALNLARTYTSAGSSGRGLAGAGWHLSYESALVEIPQCGLALVTTADGSTQGFVESEGRFRPQRGHHTRLRRLDDGSFEFEDKAAVRYRFAGRVRERPWARRLERIEEPHGDAIVLEYDPAGCLSRVSESHPRLGPVRTLVFTYAAAGGRDRVARVAAWGLGLLVEYTHDPHGNLLAARRFDREAGSQNDRYEYLAASHQMTAAIAADGSRTSYTWLPDRALPAGQRACAATRPSECVQQVRGEQTTTFLWKAAGRDGALRVEVGEAGGSPTRYLLDASGSPLEIDEPQGDGRLVWTMQWDPVHRVKTRESSSAGRSLRYQHDAAGNLIRQEEQPRRGASVEVVSYEYHPRFNVLVRKADARGRVTRWTLDPRSGALVQQVDPDGTLRSWSYDRDGCLRSETGPIGRTLYQRPDSFCVATQVRSPGGQITARRYDQRGRLVDETTGAGR